MMRLSDVNKQVQGELINGDCTFSSLSIDSRRVAQGQLFVALRGERFDGHDFLQAALQAGACGLIVERAVEEIHLPQLCVADSYQALGAIAKMHREQYTGRLIGLTGSSGKTTVKGLLTAILQQAGPVLSTQGNFNNHVGVPLTLLRLGKEPFAVVELGTSSPGEIGYLTGLAQPSVALVNNIMPAHVGGFGSLAAIAKEKAQIYSQLRADETAVINLDDRFADEFVCATRGCRQLGFTRTQEAPAAEMGVLRAANESLDSAGCPHFDLLWQAQRQPVQLRVLGAHNVANALAAAACALAVGCSLDDIATGLASFGGEHGRMHYLGRYRGAIVIDDSYNANPGSVRAAIDYLAQSGGRGFLVLGDMGELGADSDEMHKEVGRYAAELGVHSLYAVGPSAALAAQAFGSGGHKFTDQHALFNSLAPHLGSGDTVLIKGSRSAHMERIARMFSPAGDQTAC